MLGNLMQSENKVQQSICVGPVKIEAGVEMQRCDLHEY